MSSTERISPVSRFPVPKLDELPGDVRARIDEVQEKTGFVPNVFLALAHRPDEFRAFFAYHDALMERDGGLSKAEREMIVVATSAARDCPYCVVAHGAVLRVRAKDPLISDYIATNHRHAPITPRQRAILDFALEVAVEPEAVEERDRQALRDAGLSDEDVWDVISITAFFAMSNRLAHGLGILPNEEFHLMGRVPRKA